MGLDFNARNRPPAKMTGVVYAISNPAWPEWIKIGQTTLHSDYTISSLLTRYQTSSPLRDYKILAYWEVTDPDSLERHLHGRYNAKNEWVKVALPELEKIVKEFLK